MHIMPKLSILAVALLQAGCASMGPRQVANPSEITLVCAMKQLGAGFREMAIAQGDLKTGLIASEATVTFNVTAAANDSSKLAIDLSVAPASPLAESGTFGGEVGESSEGRRGNTVTVKFVSLVGLAGNVDAKKIEELIAALEKGGIHIYLAPENGQFVSGGFDGSHNEECLDGT